MANLSDGVAVAGAAVANQKTGVSPDLPGGAKPTDLKGKSIRGGAVTVFGQGIGLALQIITTLVLARLLSPTDYGLQSMVFTLTALFALFKDAGLSVATVQRDILTREQISTLFWINLLLGITLTLSAVAAAPFLAAFYKEPRLLWLTIASASIFLFDSLSVQHKALLDRSMRFGTSMKIGVLSAVIGAVVAVGMALLGCGYWSLICQNITIPIVGTTATWIAMPWIPGRPRWTHELRSMVRFGGTVTLNSIVVYVAYNTEKILLGRFWGAAPLGIYTRAYQLATLPVQQLIGAVHTVVFSVLSRLQGEAQRLQRAYLKSLTLIVSMTIPVVISTTLFADEIVLLMLGRKWMAAAAVLRLLSPAVLVFAVMNPFSAFLRATGRVGRSLKIALVICPVVIAGIMAGLHNGPTGVAAGYSSAMVLLFVPVMAWVIYGTGITFGDYWDSIKQPLISGVIAGLAGGLFKFAFHSAFTSIPLLFIGLTFSFAVYVCVLFFAMGQKDMYVDLLSHLLSRNRSLPAEN